MRLSYDFCAGIFASVFSQGIVAPAIHTRSTPAAFPPKNTQISAQGAIVISTHELRDDENEQLHMSVTKAKQKAQYTSKTYWRTESGEYAALDL